MSKNSRFIKLLSIALVCVITMVMCMGAKGKTASGAERVYGDNIEYNLETINGVQYYFQDDENYTISAKQNQIGTIELAVNDKNNLIISVYEFIVDYSFSFDEYRSISNSNYVNDENLKATIEIDRSFNFQSPNLVIGRSADKVGGQLEKYYGKEYTNRYLTSLTKDAHTAKLYETMRFEMYKKTDWSIYAGLAGTIVSALVGVPISVIAGLGIIISVGIGGYEAVRDMNGSTYMANVHWNKEVEVENDYPYRAGKTQKGYIILGDNNSVSYHKQSLTQNSDFNNNTLLLETGIYNHIHYSYD